MRSTILSLAFSFFLVLPALGQPRLKLTPHASGFVQPVEITHAGDQRIFVVERRGKIWIVQPSGQTNPTAFLDIEARVQDNAGERGLLGLAFPPDFATSQLFYTNYTRQDGATVISRWSMSASNSDLADSDSEEILFTIAQPFDNHNGGCLRFGPDSMLYIGMGDGGSGGDPGNRAQNLSNPLGKLLRIDVRALSGYVIPADNPFVGVANADDRIWAYGLRNPWRFSFDSSTGMLWIADVGQNAREEVNIASAEAAGLNYGWRCYEGNAVFNTNNCSGPFDGPLWDYQQSNATGKSVTGGYVYRGNDFGDLTGHYIFGDYVSGNIWTLFPNANGGFDTTNQGKLAPSAQLTTFGEDADGELYLATKNQGTVYKIESTTNSIEAAEATPLTFAYLPSGQIQISWPPVSPKASLTLYDLSGRMVLEVTPVNGSYLLGADLPAAIYVVKVQDGGQFFAKVLLR